MEEQIKMARLNAEYKKKQNIIKADKQRVEAGKHAALQQVDEEYHTKKRELLADIADIRKQKEGLALDDPKRADLSDEIRNIEDMLGIIRDERDIKARNVAHDAFAEHMELEEAGRRLDEWLEEEKIKVMEEQHAARIDKEAAQAEEGGEQ
jgi:hypothetical protein